MLIAASFLWTTIGVAVGVGAISMLAEPTTGPFSPMGIFNLALTAFAGFIIVWSLWLGGGLGQASALAMVMLVLMTPMIALYWVFARRQGLVAA